MKRRKTKIALYIAIVCLPFTQVPTIKALFRLRISELITWFTLPENIFAFHRRGLIPPTPVSIFLLTMILYFLYAGLIGIIAVGALDDNLADLLAYVYHPLLRTLLESARTMAIISLIIGLIGYLNEGAKVEVFLDLFLLGGALSSLYGLYQLTILVYNLPLPLLPGTLVQQGNNRPFSTFYEPTGFGSFPASATLLSLYKLQKQRKHLRHLLVFFLNSLGLIASLSTAGFFGFSVGFSVLILFAVSKFKMRRVLGAIFVSFLFAYVSYGLISTMHSDSDIMDNALSDWWIQRRLDDRIEAYLELGQALLDNPFGHGQGVLLFISAGTPGFFRLFLEGGIPGTILITIMHCSIILCLFGIFRCGPAYLRYAQSSSAAYASSLTTTLNYINTTDAWIWFIWSLPALGLLEIHLYKVRNKSPVA